MAVDPQPLETIRQTYRQIDDNFDALLAAARTHEERERVRTVHAAARDAWWKAAAEALSADDPAVRTLQAELVEANARLDRQLRPLQSATTVLEIAAEAVRLAESLTVIAAGKPASS
jgi:hypothetical protein